MGIEVGDRLQEDSLKRKFVISTLPDKNAFPSSYEDFEVEHVYLAGTENERTRLRKRGQKGKIGVNRFIRIVDKA